MDAKPAIDPISDKKLNVRLATGSGTFAPLSACIGAKNANAGLYRGKSDSRLG